MNQGLGPVVGNRFDDARKTALKPHLMERLVANTVRAVPLGTMVTEDDGRMAFVPNYTHTTERVAAKTQPAEGTKPHTFKPGDKVRVVAAMEQLNAIGIDGGAARSLSQGQLGTFVRDDNDGLPMVVDFDSGVCWYLKREMVQPLQAEGADEPVCVAGFDPMTEPLQLGDYVEVVSVGFEHGFRGKVASINSRGGFHVHYDGRAEPERAPWGNRSSLKLLARKATPA